MTKHQFVQEGYETFPFTDPSEIKIRPAVVLAGVGMQDWVLCEITSSSQVRDLYIAIGPGDMTTGKLKLRSWARPDRLTTLNDAVFAKGRLGRLSDRQARRDRSRRPQPLLTKDSSTLDSGRRPNPPSYPRRRVSRGLEGRTQPVQPEQRRCSSTHTTRSA